MVRLLSRRFFTSAVLTIPLIPLYPLIDPEGLYALFPYVTPSDDRVGTEEMDRLQEDLTRTPR